MTHTILVVQARNIYFFKNTKNKKKLKIWLELLTKMPSITITNMDVIIGDTVFCEFFAQKINLMLK